MNPHAAFFVDLFSAQMSNRVFLPAGDPADINLEIKKMKNLHTRGHHVAVFHYAKTNHAAARGSNINIRGRYFFNAVCLRPLRAVRKQPEVLIAKNLSECKYQLPVGFFSFLGFRAAHLRGPASTLQTKLSSLLIG